MDFFQYNFFFALGQTAAFIQSDKIGQGQFPANDGQELWANSDPFDDQSQPTTADLNGDAVVDTADVLQAWQYIYGNMPVTPEVMQALDNAPLINGVPQPDGALNLGDYLLIQRKALGQINF